MADDERAALGALLEGFDQRELAGDVGLAVFEAIDGALAERRRQAAPRSQVTPMWFESLGRVISGDEMLRSR